MKFWPLSVIATSPLAPTAYALEISMIATHLPSKGGYYAIIGIARHTPPVQAPNLVIIESIGAPARRVFTHYPDTAEWLRMERADLLETENGYMFILVDGLH